ncbi:hypothetical protein [Amycolatopsis echigonensis]|uniref:DUF1376 domain-containing protein n=1 Tax=Amycolatopsis echigonensis TaxID=2576905 RepID=A0A8E1W2U2_9PSEU|nr:hypothetical protein [Amycolatopsis echigonensis]MBB2502931.1 hypothetical protein [Amycolatopsis echigonensis]
MPWFNVDDGFADHPKAIRAGNAALGLWVRAGAWSAKHLTDGFVPEEIAFLHGTPTQAAKLVRTGLWRVAEGGFQFHDWSDDRRNPTRAEVTRRRSENAARQARWRSARRAGGARTDSGRLANDAGEELEAPGRQEKAEEPQVDPDGRRVTNAPGGATANTAPSTPLPSTPKEEKTLADSGEPASAEPKRVSYPEAFERAWIAYGRKGGKRTAYLEWKRAVKRAPAERITEAIEPYVHSTPEPRYRKDFERWLRGDGWESQPPPLTTPGGYRPFASPDPARYHESW